MRIKFVIFLAILCFNFGHLNADCVTKLICSECIQEPGCGWCETAMNSSIYREVHCLDETSEIASNCFDFYTVSPSIEELENKSLSSNINLTPQKIVLNLKKNQEYSFDFLYQQPSDFPVDLYVIMDMSKSMEKIKENVGSLGKNISDKLNELTKNSQIGFGTFIDKPTLPYQNSGDLDAMAHTYSFKNNLNLTSNSEDFVKAVKNSVNIENVDSPESGFDALMQAMVCKNEINWREEARHIIILITDSSSHMAGSGRLAGIVVPSDGKCHLHKGIYNESLNFDYPSLSHIDYIAQQEKKHIIFYVTKEVTNVYKELSKAIQNSKTSEIQINKKSINVLSVIEENYKSIVSTTKMRYEAPDGVKVSLSSNCSNQTSNGCVGVKIGEIVKFTAKITADSCNPSIAPQTIKLVADSGISNENLEIKFNVLCKCECEFEKNQFNHSEQCNKHGSLFCGLCSCETGFRGKQCQCAADSDLDIDNNKCLLNGKGKECSGKGTCKCGQCDCVEKEHITGAFCECDDRNCDVVNNQKCAGNGRCDCGKCKCNSGWTGSDCSCMDSQEECKNNEGKICSENGECFCNACICKRKYSGKHCEVKITPVQMCESLKDCVECQAFKTGKYDRLACKTNCTKFNTKLVKKLDDSRQLCMHIDENNCEIWFQYTENLIVEALDKKVCGTNIWTMIFIVIGSILLAGIVLLLAWKIGTTVHDKREFTKFQKEQQAMKWGAEENPLYKKASTDYSNPVFGRRSMRLNS